MSAVMRSSMRCLSLLALSAGFAATAFGDSPREEYAETIDQSFTLLAGGTFSLSNRNGSVELTTWDQDEVRIVAEKRMRLDDGAVSWLWRVLGLKSANVETDEDAQKLFDQLTIDFQGDDTRREVTAHYPESARGVNMYIAFKVTAPRRVDVNVDETNGSITVQGVDGRVELGSTSGSITVEDATGPIDVRSTNGRIRVEDVAGELSARTTNGSVEARFRADAQALQPIAMRSVNGSVRLYLPETAVFDLEARTTNGSITCDFPLAATETQSRRRLEGRVGEGGPLVEMQTTNGSVRILKLE